MVRKEEEKGTEAAVENFPITERVMGKAEDKPAFVAIHGDFNADIQRPRNCN